MMKVVKAEVVEVEGERRWYLYLFSFKSTALLLCRWGWFLADLVLRNGAHPDVGSFVLIESPLDAIRVVCNAEHS